MKSGMRAMGAVGTGGTGSAVPTGRKIYRCKTCFQEFSQRNALKLHNETEHSSDRVPCDECDKTFTTKSSLRLHKEAIHQGIRYQCDFCDKSFGQLGSLRRHMNSIHPGLKIARKATQVRVFDTENHDRCNNHQHAHHQRHLGEVDMFQRRRRASTASSTSSNKRGRDMYDDTDSERGDLEDLHFGLDAAGHPIKRPKRQLLVPSASAHDEAASVHEQMEQLQLGHKKLQLGARGPVRSSKDLFGSLGGFVPSCFDLSESRAIAILVSLTHRDILVQSTAGFPAAGERAGMLSGLSRVDREHLRRRHGASAAGWRRWGMFVGLTGSVLVLLTIYPTVTPDVAVQRGGPVLVPPLAAGFGARGAGQSVAEGGAKGPLAPVATPKQHLSHDDDNDGDTDGNESGSRQRKIRQAHGSLRASDSNAMMAGQQQQQQRTRRTMWLDEPPDEVPEPGENRLPFSPLERPAVVVLTHSRMDDLKQVLRAFNDLVDIDMVDLYLSCDLPSAANKVAALFRPGAEFEDLVKDLWVMPQDFSPRTNSFQDHALYKISEHYRFVFETTFTKTGASHVILMEEDVAPAPDFLTYFLSVGHLLDLDPTLWCVSAWNDNGFLQHATDADRLFRSNFFPNLGWMIKREFWQAHLRDQWPKMPSNGWDHWIRSIPATEERDCIVPEVPRCKHFSKRGTHIKDNGKLFSKFAFSSRPGQLDLDQANLPFGDLSYLLRDSFLSLTRAKVEAAQRITLSRFVGMRTELAEKRDAGPYLILYRREQYKLMAKQLSLWMSEPRAFFAGVIQVGHTPTLLLAEARDAAAVLEPGEGIAKNPNMRPVAADANQDCNAACATKLQGFKCDADQLPFVDRCSVMLEHFACEGGCGNQIGKELPCYVVNPDDVNFQQCLRSYSQFVSCNALHPNTRRLCACVPS
ncbi:3-mannosyl-glycoprotein 2-beta-N-acetylglucosaminyltransferase (N-glycosyl-oligosaccharide-glycoprotein N-acetylglucosaminyltransferase I) (GNT-I) (GlcNAc-T I) [Durusdinium trenchii]|uniref:alpha-1,3-mannosyl-glycoprotein 2-beta-N-acetylglucosaminyltransferase n=1 Tax=Durusdinium trenchii TaxID=1381693 RepID=A0ABP0J098_9DINO